MSLSVSLRHDFGGFRIDAAFEAPAGVTALFGRSGAGKSTVIQAVAGLIRPDHALIRLNDRVLADTAAGKSLPAHHRRIGYVFQDARLFPHLSVKQNLLYGRFFARKRLGSTAPDLRFVSEMLGIGHLLPRMPAGLSGGEKQRVAIGRALLAGPELLLMDEPLAALDAPRKAEILPYLERLRDETRLPILYVSHAPAEIARLATTIVLMESGRVTASGPAARILADPAHLPFGPRDAGGVITARVSGVVEDGLSRLDTAAGPLWLPQVAAQAGDRLRLRIPAQDVILATEAPKGLSALNILPCTILSLHQGEGPGMMVQLGLGGAEVLLARLTRRSVAGLDLRAGMMVFAIIKAVSVAHEAIGTDPA